ncbi:unnamed protein product [Diamesa serratosioi]
MKFKVLAWILSVSLQIQLISCKEVELNCGTSSDTYIHYYCTLSNSCILSNVVAEKDDEFYYDNKDKTCIVFTNSSLYMFPQEIQSHYVQNIYAVNSSIEVLPDIKYDGMNRLLFRNNQIKIIPNLFDISACVIDFANNQISSIEKNRFLTTNRNEKCKIDLSNNTLEVLPLEVLPGFSEELNFSANKIKEIKIKRSQINSDGYYAGAETSRFDLSKNMLKTIPVIVFGMTQVLDLSYNKIEMSNSTSPPKVINTISMKLLNLSFNNIQEFSFNILKHFRSLSLLDVNDHDRSPSSCSSDMEWTAKPNINFDEGWNKRKQGNSVSDLECSSD